jgi:hypothetical protein
VESGQEGPKGNKKARDDSGYPNLLEVTDMCLGFADNDDAAFRIPADPDGYAVYARVTGDPKYSPEFEFSNPELYYVQNYENPNDPDVDFLVLGYISPGGVFDADSNTLAITPKIKGNRLPKATEITSLFMWSGEVCFLDDYGEGAVATHKCCRDNTPCPLEGELGYDPDCPDFNVGECVVPELVQCCNDLNDDGDYLDPGECTETTDVTCVSADHEAEFEVTCPAVLEGEPYFWDIAYCKAYPDPEGEATSEWVFNIADFVGLFFKLNNNTGDPTGSSLLQVRFYPLPLDIGTSGNPH